MSTPDTLPQGVPYAVGELLMQALRDEPALAGVTFHDNPVRPSDLQEGERVVFFEDVSDRPAEQGEQIKRVFSFNVGVINRTEGKRLGVHTDYRAAKRALDAALPSLKDIVVTIFLREGEIAFRLENIDVGGGLILATFTLGYRDPSFRRVG